MLSGFATPEGTARYRDRFPQFREAEHFRRAEHVPGAGELWLSSIGLGTYLGEPDDAADAAYIEAIGTALRSGINVLDTAINYRHQRSERNISAALAALVASGDVQRDEVFVCTKAGYLSFDGELPADRRGYFTREYIESGVVDPKELAGGMHCMSPAYLENQIDRSRCNLGLETIDLFYLHNPESQLADVAPEVFRERLKRAFAQLEHSVKAGKLRYYGMATWNAFRVPVGTQDYISLSESVELAREVGSEGHHFRFIQLPFNLAMLEAYALNNQSLHRKNVSLLTAAAQLGVAVMGSATLYQGRLTHSLPGFIQQTLGMKNDNENAIQFARSAPGLTTSLVGMGNQDHVAANLKAALLQPARVEEWARLFTEREA
ncbi:MAG TPA: aldo/keto reductase [Terriglobales bacterium]|jgi:aryl-alcohol dehydrogenase-like predicted oxidoreductase|nr:aldo/keto reductase [Terriglobales bacterium]